MNTTLKKVLACTVIPGAIVMTGCSDDDGGGGGGAAPANAVTFTTDNAVPTIQAASAGALVYLPKGESDATPVPSVMDLIDNKKNSGIDFAAGISDSGSDIYNCETFQLVTTAGPNTYTDTWQFSETSPGPGSASGTETYNTCNFFGGGVILDGTLSWSSTWTNPAGPWTESSNGSLSVEFTGETVTLSGISFTASGDDSDGSYTYNVAFTYDTTVVDMGFGMFTSSPISGNWNTDVNGCPAEGALTFNGAGGSTAIATFNQPAGMMTVTVNGVEATGSPIACLNI